ncbi:type III secretion protein [Phyllobacterium salinisoli]|uniref:Type III secretion protein n=1 Tax=Phyllobacterium salinisoli TaxID=1899321 RepID=A0A368JWM8_9HYPH|nr:flagellar biosynthetic protein FliR [Phyllobacterium salinisoli]RCS21566.1 type III secretion protein [Phyllobacterium salinisoli]
MLDGTSIIQEWDSLLGGLILLIARSAAFFALCPLLSRNIIPHLVRFAIITVSALVCLPTVSLSLDGNFLPSGLFYIGLLFKELCLGYLLGVLTWLPMRSLEIAGVILDTQRGNMNGQEPNTVFGSQTTTTTIFLSQIFSGYFFAAGGWLTVTGLLYESMDLWPVLTPMPPLDDRTVLIFFKFLGAQFSVALTLVLPILGMMFIADVIIAYIARVAPSLNALTFGMPIKTAIMLFLLIFYLDVLYPRILSATGNVVIYLSSALVK